MVLNVVKNRMKAIRDLRRDQKARMTKGIGGRSVPILDGEDVQLGMSGS